MDDYISEKENILIQDKEKREREEQINQQIEFEKMEEHSESNLKIFVTALTLMSLII